MRPSGDSRPALSFGFAPGLALAFAGLATAQGTPGDGPDLSPPGGMPAPIVSRPLAPGPTAEAAAPPASRAVLAVPGLMGRSSLPSTPAAAVDAPGAPALDGPLEMPAAPPVARTRGGVPGRPVIIEPIPIDGTPRVYPPGPRTAGPSRRISSAPDVSERITPAPPQRRGRLFGLRPGQTAATPAPRALPPGRAVVDDVKSEPMAESALRGRIEKQARSAVGDRARLIDVQVEGRSVTVQARGVKFLQKRAVRKSLESLPALSGLRSTIEVLD